MEWDLFQINKLIKRCLFVPIGWTEMNVYWENDVEIENEEEEKRKSSEKCPSFKPLSW